MAEVSTPKYTVLSTRACTAPPGHTRRCLRGDEHVLGALCCTCVCECTHTQACARTRSEATLPPVWLTS